MKTRKNFTKEEYRQQIELFTECIYSKKYLKELYDLCIKLHLKDYQERYGEGDC